MQKKGRDPISETRLQKKVCSSVDHFTTFHWLNFGTLVELCQVVTVPTVN